MKLPGEIARFQVLPAGRRSPLYWTVLVFANKGYMRRAFHKLNLHPTDRDDRFGAIIMPEEHWQVTRGRKKSEPFLGYALFARTQLGMGTQCHEAVHMALGYLRRIRKIPRLHRETDPNEEALAYCIGGCAAQLNNNFLKSRCYRN